MPDQKSKPDYRGGNSRQLARSLDQLQLPMAILDRSGQILFVNAELCRMVDADATQLVGKQVRWDVAKDDERFGALLTGLAPPPAARSGRVTLRKLTAPLVYGSDASGQLFVPVLGEEKLVHVTIVLLGPWEDLQAQVPAERFEARPEVGRALVKARSDWPRLDGLLALLGESPAIELAMQRAQLASTSESNFWVYGAPYCGQASVVKGIFSGRLLHQGLQLVAGQFFPVDCQVLDLNLIEGMLEVFAGRLRPDASRGAQLLVLEHVQHLSEASASTIAQWLSGPLADCSVAATSDVAPTELAALGTAWEQLACRIAVTELELPALRTRREDIPALAQQALALTCQAADRAVLMFAPGTMDLLLAYPWAQNLTQLRSAIEQSVELAVLTNTIQPQHLPVEIRTYASSAPETSEENFEPIHLDDVLLEVEKVILRRAMKLSPRNRAQVARWLNISRPRLLRRIEQLGLNDRSEQ